MAKSEIRKAKATYVKSKFEEHAKDGAKFWRELRKIYTSSKSKSSSSKIQLVDPDMNEQIPDTNTANYIKDYFINVGKVNLINMN